MTTIFATKARMVVIGVGRTLRLGLEWPGGLVRGLTGVATLFCVAVMLGMGCSAGGPLDSDRQGNGSLGFWGDLDMANAWVRLTNDDGEMNLAGTVSFASSQIGQYGAVVIIDGVHWTNESVRENDHLLDGPVIVNSHADVESVAVIVGGLSGVALSCGKAKE